jgi:threonyl-tRNA synthetase
MIHRAILGSLERFMGILIEHYAGNFPLWLAPEQVRILPISEKTNDYAKSVQSALQQAELRTTLDLSDDKIGAKIARAHSEKVPYMLVVGPKEAETGTVNVRVRQSQDTLTLPLDRLCSTLKAKMADRALELTL